MTVLLSVTTNPQTFSGGTYNTAATAMNSGISRFTFTPSAASTTYTGGNFHILFAQAHGGIWLNDAKLELYDTPNDNLVFSRALTWTAGQPVTVKIDAQSGSRAVTISGATSGNGTFTFTIGGPYYDPTVSLYCGKYLGGGAPFDFVGTISSIDDAVTSDTVTAAAVAVAGDSVLDSRGLKATIVAAAVPLVGGNISEGQSNRSDGVTPAAVTAVGGAISVKRAYKVAPVPDSVLIVGGNVIESRGGLISLGPTAVDFQKFSFANRASSIVMNTPTSGAVVLLCAGGNNTDLSTAWTDNKNATAPVVIGALVSYPDFAGYGTIIAMTPAPMTGGTSHTFTQQVGTGDENTTFGLTAIVAGGHPRVTEVHNNVNNATGTTQQTSPTINIDDEALLVAYWWGASPVVPPFSTPSPGVGTPYTAVPNNGYTVAQSYLVNNEFGEVQGAMAYLYVPAGGGPSARNVTWTHSPAQGAQLRLVAIQPALSDGITGATIGIVGQAIGEHVTYRVALNAASTSVVGGSITEGLLRVDNITPASLALDATSVSDRRVLAASVSSAALALTGGAVQDQVSHNQRDTVGSATAALTGGFIADRVGIVDAIALATTTVVGGVVPVRYVSADAISQAAITLAGQDVHEVVSNDPLDVVLPAAVSIADGAIGDRVVRVVPVVSSTLVVTSSALLDVIARRVAVQPAVAVLSGGVVSEKRAFKDTTLAAATAVTGGLVQDVVTTGAQDHVFPASLAVAGVLVNTRIAHVGTISPATCTMRGVDVQFVISTPVAGVTPPIPPGRVEPQLIGHVVVPSIESRESQLSHLYGVVRSKDV